MRQLLGAAIALAGLTLVASPPAHAYPAHHALQGNGYPGWSFWKFDTYAQCRATASGINAACAANPFFDGRSDDPYAYQNRPRPYAPGPYPVPRPGYTPR
jgi:hypothetical protein